MGNEHSRAAGHGGPGPEDNAGTDSAPSPAVTGTGLVRPPPAAAADRTKRGGRWLTD